MSSGSVQYSPQIHYTSIIHKIQITCISGQLIDTYKYLLSPMAM